MRWRTVPCIAGVVVAGALVSALQSRADDRDDPHLDPVPIVEGELAVRIDDWLWRMEKFGMHGAILIVRDGKVILKRGYGIADHDSNTRITYETIFDIGSLAKQFTAAAVLKLQMQGALDVDDPIALHLADVPTDKRDITIHHLLTHTSGLPYQPNPGVAALDHPLQAEPGTTFSYSNVGYAVLADVIEATSGRPFEAYVTEELFKAARLRRTGFRGTVEAPLRLFARAYTDSTAQGSAADALRDGGAYRGAGGVVSCLDDLSRWERAIATDRILDAPSREQFFTEHVRNTADTMGYAYGWMTAMTERGTRIIMHQGNFGGFNSDYRRYLDEDVTITFLSNHFVNGTSMRDAVVNHVSRLVNGTEVDHAAIPDPPTVIDLPPHVRALFEGVFELPSDETITVEVDDETGDITATPSGQRGLDLLFAPGRDERDAAFVEQCAVAADAIVNAVVAHDPDAFREHCSPALPWQGAWQGLGTLLRNLELAHGAYESHSVFGTALNGRRASGRTSVDLQFVAGSARIALTFGPQLLHFETLDSPPTCRLQPCANDALCDFNIFTGRRHIIDFVQEVDGRASAIVFEIGLGERVTALRID